MQGTEVARGREARSYALTLRTPAFAWWKPLTGLLLAVLLFLILQTVLLTVLATVMVVSGRSPSVTAAWDELGSSGTVTPWSMLFLNLTLASLTVVAGVVVRLVHGLRLRWLTSVLPGIRWRFLGACCGVAVVSIGTSMAVSTLLPTGDHDSGRAAVPTGELLLVAVVIVVTTPLQSIGEEYGFRGYLLQVFGSFSDWLAESFGASPRVARLIAQTVALLLTSTLFALAHGTQNFPLFFDRFAFGFIAGLTAILLGGLEAGIALHVLNNLVAFGFAIAYDQMDSALTVSVASWWQLVSTVVQNGLYLLLVLLVARRMGVRRTIAAAPESSSEPAPV